MSLRERITSFLDTGARRPSILESTRVRLIGTVLAAVVFIGGSVAALTYRPELLHGVDLATWLLVWACVPLTVIANSTQFWLMGCLTHTPLTPIRAVLITLFSTAANMLPLPGGSLVRIAALKTADNTYRATSLVTILAAGCRIGVALIATGVSLLLLSFPQLGLTALTIGLFTSAAATVGLLLKFHASAAWLTALGLLHILTLGIGALRLWLCFRALNAPVDPLEAVVLTLAGVISTLVGIAPAGLGIAEVTAAGIGFVIGVSATAAFLAEALNRVTGLLFIGPLVALINHFDRHGKATGHRPVPGNHLDR